MSWQRNTSGVIPVTNVSGRVLLDSLVIGNISFGVWIVVCDSIANSNDREFSIINATISSNGDISFNRLAHLITGNHIGLFFDVAKENNNLVLYGITNVFVNYNIFRFWSNDSYSSPILTNNSYGGGTKIPVISVNTSGEISELQEITNTPNWDDIESKPTTVAESGLIDALSTSSIIFGNIQDILLKNSNIPNYLPSANDLEFGELFINSYDGLVAFKKNDGLNRIITLQPNLSTPGAGVVKQITSGNIPAITGTTLITFNNSIPKITDGVQLWARTYTPTGTSVNILINCLFLAAVQSNNRSIISTIFRNDVCIGTSVLNFSTGGVFNPFSFLIIDAPNTTDTITYSCRIGMASGNQNPGSWYVNQLSTPFFGGTLAKNGYIILEW